jgi:hypothetical protein
LGWHNSCDRYKYVRLQKYIKEDCVVYGGGVSFFKSIIGATPVTSVKPLELQEGEQVIAKLGGGELKNPSESLEKMVKQLKANAKGIVAKSVHDQGGIYQAGYAYREVWGNLGARTPISHMAITNASVILLAEDGSVIRDWIYNSDFARKTVSAIKDINDAALKASPDNPLEYGFVRVVRIMAGPLEVERDGIALGVAIQENNFSPMQLILRDCMGKPGANKALEAQFKPFGGTEAAVQGTGNRRFRLFFKDPKDRDNFVRIINSYFDGHSGKVDFSSVYRKSAVPATA